MSTLPVELVAADRRVFRIEEATFVSARSIEGELGIMANHQPILAMLSEGEVRVKSAEGETVAHVNGGFLCVDHNRVLIVSEVATTD